MNQNVEARLRAALGEAADTVDTTTLRPLVAPRKRIVFGGLRLRRPALAVAGAAVAAVAVAGGLVFFRPVAPTATPAAGTAYAAQTTSTAGDISVFLCTKTSPYPPCRGDSPGAGRAATQEEIKAVGRMLRSRPEVDSVIFEDRQTAFENFKRMYQDNKVLLAATKPDDLPESYRVYLKPGADPHLLVESVQAMPGVATVIDQRCMERAKRQADPAKGTGATPSAVTC
jgi:Cell division protein